MISLLFKLCAFSKEFIGLRYGWVGRTVLQLFPPDLRTRRSEMPGSREQRLMSSMGKRQTENRKGW